MEHKSLPLTDYAVSESGSFSGYAAVFGNVDAGGDIIAPGAFAAALPDFLRDGFIGWSHDWRELVAYPTTASEDDHGLRLEAAFHSTARAQEARVITAERAAAGLRMGLSIGYRVADEAKTPAGHRLLRSIAPLYEVSLVAVPMNREANVAAVKTATRPHSTPTTDDDWDADAARARLPSERDALRAAHAWVDDDADPDTKAAWRFIHHAVDGGGTVGAANLRACSTGIAVLNGARGGTTIPDADREGVWRHLARHLRDAEREPPELRSAKEGRVLSAVNRERLAALADALRITLDDLDRLLADTTPASGAEAAGRAASIAALAEEARFLGVPFPAPATRS